MAITSSQLIAQFSKMKLGKYGKAVAADVKVGVQLRAAKPGARVFSKLGGAPELPVGMEWPVRRQGKKTIPLSFLAQVDFEEASKHEKSGLLPRVGKAWFFYDAINGPWGFEPKDRDGWKVVFSEAKTLTKRAMTPKALSKKNTGTSFAERRVSFRAIETFPGIETARIPKAELNKRWDELYEAFRKTVTKLQGYKDGSDYHRMMGHATVIKSPMESECQLVSNGISTGDELTAAEERKAKKLSKGDKDWVLLMQLDSDDSLWMWGDLGMLYFWIRRQAPEARDFSKGWVILQCG